MGIKHETLIYAIFKQAFDDYNDLVSRGISVKKTKEASNKSKYKTEGEYSMSEIKKFFRSGWCNTLLCMIGKENEPSVRQMINKVWSEDGVVDYQRCFV